jgi:hypothetical protein
LETVGGEYHPKEWLEEARVEPTQGEMAEANLSEGETEQLVSDETAELEYEVEWQAKATRD